MNPYTFRKAQENDLTQIWEIILQAKAQMKRQGSCQWNEHYPTIETIQDDIINENGYVICLKDQVVAYGVISFDGEPVYDQIKAQWASDQPYAIVHRLAVADEVKKQGIARKFMLQAEKVSLQKNVYHLRVDTKYDNEYMLRLITSLGFSYRGNVFYRNYTEERQAYEKSLTIPQLNEHNKQEYPPMHTVEHLLNQTMIRMFGCPRSKNAHIERKKSKCDYELSEAPTPEMIAEIERRVNEVIDQHLPVTIEFIPKAEATQIVDLSKLPDNASETLRIVRIGDYDVCACIGSHVSNTSEIGHFKMLTYDYTDGRLRLRFKLTE